MASPIRPVAHPPANVEAWLRQRPSLAELQAAYPQEWAAVDRDLTGLAGRGDLAELTAYVTSLAQPAAAARVRPEAGDRPSDAVVAEVRRRMATAAVKRMCRALATGTPTGRVRFNLLNGYVAQKLLFARDLERKPVSMFWFRVFWPLLWQRRVLLPLVGPKGIYCFYSRQLIASLAVEIGDRRCLEIAAGDGTLSRFLGGAGVQITATDDHSWRHAIDFPADVLRQDARTALRVHRPEVVICSWPPAGNAFEREVFRSRGVQEYIVIGSRHEFAAGNWTTYRRQATFTYVEDERLSRLVLPPELESAVYVFRRTA